ncbi:MAG TPA: hypothetical protein VF221_21255 [Chloroflexota bacterium]
MIGQITPLVKVASTRIWVTAVVGHVAGSVVSAMAVGWILGSIGMLIGSQRWTLSLELAGLAFLACAVQDTTTRCRLLPTLQRQTPKRLREELGPVWGPLVWGIDLGQGWTTRIVFSGYYALVVSAFLVGSPLSGCLLVGVYGLSRTLPIVVAILQAAHGEQGQLGFGYIRREMAFRQASIVLLSLTAGYLIVS